MFQGNDRAFSKEGHLETSPDPKDKKSSSPGSSTFKLPGLEHNFLL